MPKDERPEEEKLAELERSIVEAETKIARQALLMEQLGRDGHSTTEAHALLNEITGDMASMHAHRRHLLRRMKSG
jgi:hypothetical protein